jgi:hypothetical protein
MPTLTGLLLIPLSLVACVLGLRAQLAVFGVGAVLTSAAVINLASFGIQPAYFMGLLLLGGAGVATLVGAGYRLDRGVLVRMAPLLVLLLAALNALFWAGTLFWDRVWVVSGRQMFDMASAEHYSFRSENVNQLVYLILNLSLMLLLANRLVRLPAAALLRAAHGAVQWAFWFATLFVAWDWMGHHFDVYFPDAFVHSNAFYAVAHKQSFGDLARISGPFAEPSALAYAYAGFLAYASGLYLAERSVRALAMVVAAVGSLAISTSTTAYAVLALWAVSMLLALPLARLVGGHVRSSPASRLAVFVLLVASVIGGAVIVDSNQDAIQQIYQNAIIGKTATTSFEDRGAADRMALDTFETTGGFGIGLGSHRPSTLPAALLSNVGLPGTLAFLVFIGLALRRGGHQAWSSKRVLWPFRAFTLGLLAGHCISSPDLNTPLLWLSLTLNLAISAHRGATEPMPATAQAAVANHPPRSGRSRAAEDIHRPGLESGA